MCSARGLVEVPAQVQLCLVKFGKLRLLLLGLVPRDRRITCAEATELGRAAERDEWKGARSDAAAMRAERGGRGEWVVKREQAGVCGGWVELNTMSSDPRACSAFCSCACTLPKKRERRH